MADWNAICFDAMPGLRSGLPLSYSRQRLEPPAAAPRGRPAIAADTNVKIDAPSMQDALGDWYKRLP